MEERERLARLICGALTGYPADTEVYSYIDGRDPMRVRLAPGVHVAPSASEVHPLWILYGPAADVIIADRERQAEVAPRQTPLDTAWAWKKGGHDTR